ncbi:MAG: hypothetical protein JRF63_15920, partial [Deltaproteobacteria bacterium]|nr:hypothetical protein [Deltaproteobacteria bacterium]
ALPLGFTVARGRWGALATAVTAMASLLVAVLSEPATWSPYSRITVEEWVEQGETEMKGYELSVNRAYHMTIVDLHNPPTTDGWYQRAALHYNLPYRFSTPQRVLVLGSGGGNDVAAAVRHGALQIAAVEIDPVIVRAGRNLHPERPYHVPQVSIHVDDARSFLERSDQFYDLIALGLLDSHTLLAGLPGVRLDNYVYTVEAMHAARRRLSPNGILCLSFAALGDRPWLADKLYRMIEIAFDEPPLAYWWLSRCSPPAFWRPLPAVRTPTSPFSGRVSYSSRRKGSPTSVCSSEAPGGP